MIKAEHIRHLQERGKHYITDKKTIQRFGLNSGTWHKAAVIFYNCRDCEGKRAKGYLEIKARSKWYKLPGHETTLIGDYQPKTKKIILCEGENDCFTAHSKGIQGACCFTTGASSIPAREKLEVLRYKSLAIVYDQDKGGREGAKRLAGELIKPEYGIREIKIISLPVEEGKDLTDFFNEGHTAEELENLIELTTSLNHPNYREQYELIEQYRDKIYNEQRAKHSKTGKVYKVSLIEASKRDKVYTMADYIIRRANIYTGEFSDSFSRIGQRWRMSRQAIMDLWQRTFKAWGLLDWKGRPGRNEQTTFRVIGYPIVRFESKDKWKQTD